MPYKCCVPHCRGNYRKGPKVHIFGFPTDARVCQKWVDAIPRVGFRPTKNTKVCELHFSKESIIWSVSQTDSRTGETVTATLSVPRLQKTAVPTRFLNCPEYSTDESKDEPLQPEKIEFEEAQLNQASEQCQQDYLTSIFDNYDDFLAVFRSFEIENGWITIYDKDKVTVYKVVYTPGPVITYAIVINSNLRVETFLYGQKMFVSVNNFRTPFTINSLYQIKDILEVLDAGGITNANYSRSRRSANIHSILDHVSNILDSLGDNEDSGLCFISEQLKLRASSKQRYRYSNNITIFSSIMFTISLQAYKLLRRCSFLILPHPETVKLICNKFLTKPTPAARQSFRTYAQSVGQCLSENEKFVILLIDKIGIQPDTDKGSNTAGTACNKKACAATVAFTFTITSIYSNFKKVVHVSPTSKINHDMLHMFIKTIIINLEEVGFRVFCVVSDNDPMNDKAMSKFAQNNKLSIVYPHPVSSNRPLFFLYDSAHLLKCIKLSWLNSEPNQILNYPDFESGTENLAAFQTLKELQALKHDKLLNFDYTLNLKALLPSNLEEQNALKIFNPFMTQALVQFGANIDRSKDTANFIEIIVKWWKIVSSKDKLKDVYQEAIVQNLTDPKLAFLQKILNWLDIWKTGQFSRKLTTFTLETLNGLCHTIHGMLEITKYCFDELKLNYILLGKFQSDSLEHKFGKDRQPVWGDLCISVQQLYESERRLRIQSLLTLKSPTFGNILVDKFHEDIDEIKEEKVDVSFYSRITFDVTDFQQDPDDTPVVTYLGGYCCYVVLEKLKCEFCKPKLVYPKELLVEDSYNLIKDLNRGILLFPHDTVVKIVLSVYVIFNKLLQALEDDFLKAPNKRNVISQLVLKYLLETGHLLHFHGCQNHSKEYLSNVVINCIANVLLKTYCGKRTEKRKLSAMEWGYFDQV